MKTESLAQGSAEEPGSPKSFWSLQIGKICQSLQSGLGRPVPCEQGAADLWATASSADLRFWVCVSGGSDCEFVVLCSGF